MEKIYVIKHIYDVDGGFGDAVAMEEVIGFCTSEEEAQKYVEKYQNEHVYDRPYSDLFCGELVVEELRKISDECFENAWWLK